ncbi:DNA glycosylase [Gorgonomyces haynaldii]|nr:DNA glycosylase [Gorgonomyces haynaldii]
MKRKTREQDEILETLKKLDEKLIPLIDKHPDCSLFEDHTNTPFQALTSSIISQQLSVKAADNIKKRFDQLVKQIEPQRVLELSANELREVGLSARKAEYLHCLAKAFIDNDLTSEKLESMSDSEITETLIAVKGIGEWSVHMFLMFYMKRLNVLPVKDLGIRKGMGKLLGKNMTEKQCLEYGEKWHPYKSVASWYMWQLKDSK